MPSAVVQGPVGHGGTGLAPNRDDVGLHAFGRGGLPVRVYPGIQGGRHFVKLMAGPAKGSTYWLPDHELQLPKIQPPALLPPPQSLPHDRSPMQPTTFDDEPDSEVCPHSVGKHNGAWTYDEEMGLWVHGEETCRRPSRSQLEAIMRVDGGIW